MILLASSSEGQAFIQTSSLDGEKNLKKRLIPKDFNIDNYTKNNIYLPKDNAKLDESGVPDGDVQIDYLKESYPTIGGKCECEDPNPELYEFSGQLILKDKIYPLSANQLLLKGSILKNTMWILGFVVYTGN